MTLTKANIVETIRVENGFSRNQSVETLETLLEIIKRTLESGEDVLLSGFGKFCVRLKKERKGRNPATGEDMMLKPRKVATFRCSSKLRDQINAE
ncbi:MAG: integration host factor subunit alpha [Proteobacteria bacterium]|nr:integration host factor subunit alpha [Desulfobacteraceae bacterium]MBU2522588.1 integration host factor subunit alpha [Pseudomonadota bacterium]MBU3981361.1 integration host factor subunit alpha [Pseudomonadota bacterium]MBU4012674.1 integration host factor subunit alpha [Pseudomonadota bacterium]MBU4101716.1 integration host factor subunit alpha [Pseudomonadota bacterium]